MNKFNNLFLVTMVVVLSGCEPLYDPVKYGDIPRSQGSTWNKLPIVVKKTANLPYQVSDLTGTMTLSRLLDIALYNNPSTRVSWNAARASAYAFRASLSSYYPTIVYSGSLSAQYERGTQFADSGQGIVTSSTTTATTGTTTTSTSNHSSKTNLINNVSLTYLLLDFGGRNANAELALWTLYSSNWQHNYTMQEVMLSVLNAYTSYIGNKGLANAYAENLKDAQVALEASELMRKNGLATLNDVLLSQSTLEQTRASLIQAQGAEKTSIGELLIAVGLPADTEINMEQLPQKLPVIEISGTISELLELAKKSRPDLGIAIATIKQQEAQLAISYSSGMPTFTSYLDSNQIRFFSPKQSPGYIEVASLELNFPIFQGYYFMNQQRQLRAQVKEAMANLDVQVAAVSMQVITSYYSFKTAEAALPSTESALEYAKRAYRGFVVQYKTGSASMLDILTALTTLSNARAQEVLTHTQWAASLANLAFSVGALDENGGVWKKDPQKNYINFQSMMEKGMRSNGRICYILFIAFSLSVNTGCSKSKQNQTPAAPKVMTTVVNQQDVPIYIEAIGQVISPATINIRPQVSGKLIKANIEQGAFVKEGDILYEIDPRPYQAIYEQAVAQLKHDQSLLEYAQSAVKRYKEVVTEEFISVLNYEQYESNSNAAQAQVDLDKAAVTAAQINLDFCKIVAPASGKISYFNVYVGNILAIDDPNQITILLPLTPIDILFSLPQQQFELIRKEQGDQGKWKYVAALPEHPNDKYEGTTYFIDNQINQSTGTILLKGRLPNEKQQLWPGEFIRVKVLNKIAPGALTVPPSSVLIGKDGPYVYTVDKGGKAIAINVIVLTRTEEYIAIQSDHLQAGDTVIVDGQINVAPGLQVNAVTNK